jgi:small subunit ribosomal protein S1
MSDETMRPTEAEGAMEEESFAALFAASESKPQQRLRAGEKVQGTIIDITGNNVFIDTGSKIDAVADRDELCDKEGNFPYQPGDVVELYVVSVNKDEVRLSKAASGAGGAEALRDAYENKIPVQGKVSGTCKGGFNVQVMGRRAFCPVSQMDAAYVEDLEAYVGQEFTFRVVTFEQNGRNIVLSRRQLLDEERKESTDRFLAEVQPGALLEGTVTRIKPYGAFVELMPGLEGLIHISELGWSRVDKPEDMVKPGEKLEVKVLSVDREPKKNTLRISLSAKQAGQDPWLNVADTVAPGDMVEGVVVRLAPFGAFVELIPGVEGLVHISELSFVKRVLNPEEIVSPGQVVQVKVKDIDQENRRIGLSLRDAQGDPWDTAGERFAPGAKVTGVVEKREKFGLFVNLAPGITGLMPKSLISRAAEAGSIESLRPGEEIEAVVQALDTTARKLTLAPVDLQESEDKDQWRKEAAHYAQEQTVDDDGGMNLLGDKFQEAFSRKKGRKS